MWRKPPVSSKPAQQPLAVKRFFNGRGLKLLGMLGQITDILKAKTQPVSVVERG
ncbi:hypothetical protein ALQ20_200016 [Pseudomonas syringae pv. atrofaciens]|nr:hypothetical protein ALQ20_200016 [Pseudomonas syringae pv. atrofaciens]